ncbi:hypothetical protein, partial [Candidatus Chloroploca sp. Khr17]|uniref:hypothetical protein n=1 Tax=Candidatus Chloroploca sp. Khr17 TaxID=2496869 RepID=UPI00196AF0B3
NEHMYVVWLAQWTRQRNICQVCAGTPLRSSTDRGGAHLAGFPARRSRPPSGRPPGPQGGLTTSGETL